MSKKNQSQFISSLELLISTYKSLIQFINEVIKKYIEAGFQIHILIKCFNYAVTYIKYFERINWKVTWTDLGKVSRGFLINISIHFEDYDYRFKTFNNHDYSWKTINICQNGHSKASILPKSPVLPIEAEKGFS